MSLLSSCWLVAFLGFAAGCSASGRPERISLGGDGTGGAPGGGATGSGGSPILIGDAGRSKGLSARIESPQGVTVDFVTLTCSNQCADVKAVAKGGFEPYTFVWEDGSTDSARHVCPASTSEYHVTVTDAGSNSAEFRRSPETAVAPLRATVIECPDGGSLGPGGSPGLPDAGAPGVPPVYWATWADPVIGAQGSAQGTMSPPAGDVKVAFTGAVGLSSAKTGDPTLSGVGQVLFLPASTYQSPMIPNAPPTTGMITIWDSTTETQTITFSQPVRDPLIAFAALAETWAFDATPTVISVGPNDSIPFFVPPPYTLTVTGNTLVGNDGSGVVQFTGTFTSIHFTVPAATLIQFTGFTVGIRGRG